jgi:hypothetical protein
MFHIYLPVIRRWIETEGPVNPSEQNRENTEDGWEGEKN